MLKQTVLSVIRLLVGGLFIFSGLIKVNDPVGTAIKLEEYFDVFSNDIASFFIHFKEIALPLAVFLVVTEVVLGVMLILGVRLRLTVWALGLMILFFTFLTFYSAYFNKVTDCGCFGDAIKLTPWESFTKDIILLVLIAVLFVYRKDLPNQYRAWAHGVTYGAFLLSVVIAFTAINNLPFIDFRAYKEGVNINTAMQPSAPLKYAYIMKKGDELVEFDQYPADESLEFVEMKLLNEDALPKISDFAVWNDEGTFTEEILQGKKLVILVTNMAKINTDHLEKIDELLAGLAGTDIEPVLVAASSTDEINQLVQSRSWQIKSYQGDATVIKTIMRSNPGTMILSDGVVVKKYHYRNTPSADEVKELLPWMRTPLKIILLGLPGSGKSTFGKLIARKLNFAFVDLDQVIETETGKKIREIFQDAGEGKFRELETHYLEKVLNGVEGFVLATGGGTPCFNDNMDLINEKGISVYLDVSMDEIFRRLHKDEGGKRPLFAGLDEGEMVLKLKNLLAEREFFYNQAKIKLSGDDISTEHLISELLGYF